MIELMNSQRNFTQGKYNGFVAIRGTILSIHARQVTVARALINTPEVLADEPTAHLDSRLSGEFMEIMLRPKGEGKTILVAGHDPVVYDSAVVGRLIEMRDSEEIGAGVVQ